MTSSLAVTAARVLSATSLAASSILFSSAWRTEHRVSNWLGLFVLAMGQIVIGSIILSELNAITLLGFTIVHLIFLAVSFLVVIKGGNAPRASDYFPPLDEIARFARSNKLLLLFGVCVALILIVVVLPAESIPGDAAHYHLARAQYWLENQSARHFFTDDFRQVEFPPNTSFLYLWQFLVSGSYLHLNMMQWLAAALTGLAIGGLAKHGGQSAAASMFAGLVYLTLSSIVLQMSTPLDDNLTAWLAASLVYFMFLAIERMISGQSNDTTRLLLYSGIAFGLLLGSKLTPIFLIPPFGIIIIVMLYQARSVFTGRLAVVGGVLLVGFLVFGSYNYVLNWLEYGNPIASTTGWRANQVDVVSTENPDAAQSAWSPQANFVRYAYQIMDWRLVKPIPGADTLFLYNRLAYHAIDEWFHLDLESVGRIDLVHFGMRQIIPGGEVGYGPLGYLVFFGSMLLLPFAVWRNKRHKVYRFSMALIVLGFGWLVLFSSLIPWTSAKIRYFSISFAFLVPAVVPFLYDKKRIAYLWIVPAMALAIWTLAQVSEVDRQYSAAEPSLSDWQVNLLRKAFPTNARVGTSGMVDFIYYLRKFPRYTFLPVAQDEIGQRLHDGNLDAVLADDPKGNIESYQLPFEHGQVLLVDDPKTVLLSNLGLYGAELSKNGSSSTLELKNSGLIQRLGPDLIRIFLPATGPVTMDVPLDLSIAFPVVPSGRDVLAVSCDGSQLQTQIEGATITAALPAASLAEGQAYLYCEVRISDYDFGGQVPSDSISVVVRPRVEP